MSASYGALGDAVGLTGCHIALFNRCLPSHNAMCTSPAALAQPTSCRRRPGNCCCRCAHMPLHSRFQHHRHPHCIPSLDFSPFYSTVRTSGRGKTSGGSCRHRPCGGLPYLPQPLFQPWFLSQSHWLLLSLLCTYEAPLTPLPCWPAPPVKSPPPPVWLPPPPKLPPPPWLPPPLKPPPPPP